MFHLLLIMPFGQRCLCIADLVPQAVSDAGYGNPHAKLHLDMYATNTKNPRIAGNCSSTSSFLLPPRIRRGLDY